MLIPPLPILQTIPCCRTLSRKENTLEKEKVRQIKKNLEDNIRTLKEERAGWVEERAQFQQKQLEVEKLVNSVGSV